MIFKGKKISKFGRGFSKVSKEGRPLIWIHAVSLGETRAVAPLVKSLVAGLNHPIILFTSTTETGLNEAKKIIAAHYHFYLPFDLSWIIRPIVKTVKPDLVILCESDFWYNFLQASKDVGAMTAVVNAKLSTQSMKRFKCLKFFTKRLFNVIDHLYVQSNIYLDRFLAIGVPENKMVVTGNIKFDTPAVHLAIDEMNHFKHDLGVKTGDFLIVVGSTHPTEEISLLNEMVNLLKVHPNLKVMIVPRHPERFDDVAQSIEAFGESNEIKVARFSTKLGRTNWQVMLVDAMGILRKCYHIADAAIVAGSFTDKVGGHNILEPCMSSVPSLFGPHMFSQPDLVEIVLNNGAGLQVSLKTLSQTLVELITNEKMRKTLGVNGLNLTKTLTGATDRTLSHLLADYNKHTHTPS
jgi:3-deoxy-D-manno-octulosonic-acid transferase